MVYIRYTTVTRDAQTRQLFARHRVVCIALWSADPPNFAHSLHCAAKAARRCAYVVIAVTPA
jgi:hypothetical protein